MSKLAMYVGMFVCVLDCPTGGMFVKMKVVLSTIWFYFMFFVFVLKTKTVVPKVEKYFLFLLHYVAAHRRTHQRSSYLPLAQHLPVLDEIAPPRL